MPPKPGLTLQIKRSIAASPDKVFRAWTNPDWIMRWFAPTDQFQTPLAETDLRVGGRYRIRMVDPAGVSHTVGGVYREIVPGKKLVFTWAWEKGDPMGGEGETLVTLELTARDGGTELILTHENFGDEPARDHHQEGWTGCLERLGRRGVA